MSEDMPLEQQYQLAILVDFFGPADRLRRRLGDADVDARFDALDDDPGIAERLRPAHRRARALLDVAAERADALADMDGDIVAVTQCLREMQEWSR